MACTRPTVRILLLSLALVAGGGLGGVARPALGQQTPPAAVPAVPRPATASVIPPATPGLVDPAMVLRSPDAPQQERDEAARRLVARQTPEARAALAAALQDATNRGAQLAAARAIPLDPNPDPNFVFTLFALVGNRPDLSEAALQALATYRDAPDVRNRLIELAVDPQRQQREATRKSAVRAVGTMADKRAARALVDLVSSDAESPAVRDAAAAALMDMTAMTAGANPHDPVQWQRWWAANVNKDDATFERDLLAARSAQLTLLRQRMERVVADAQAKLAAAYQLIPDKNKEAVLLQYLRAPEPETRIVGAQLVQDDFKNNRPIPDSVRNQLRLMVGDSSSQVRVVVAKAIFLLNDDQAIGALLQQVAREPDADVRMALAQALVPMRDERVVDSLVSLLGDPSPAVAEVAASGLADKDLAALIQKNPALAQRVAGALRAALEKRAAVGPGTVPLRAALVDAMGALKDPNFRGVYEKLVRPPEPVIVRRATLRALGQLGRPNRETWPADIIVGSLGDQDDSIRLEAVHALQTTADFNYAESLYALLKDVNPTLREDAWTVLRALLDEADNTTLARWADRAGVKENLDWRIDVLGILAKHLEAQQNLKDLATVNQNIGDAQMTLSDNASKAGDLDTARRRARTAEIVLDKALGYYRSKNPNNQQNMTTSALIERMMDARLASGDYPKASDFASASIAQDPSNLEAMGMKLRNEVDRLSRDGRTDDALKLIDAINKMNPQLASPYIDKIHQAEQGLRGQIPAPPRSAIGNIQDVIGDGK